MVFLRDDLVDPPVVRTCSSCGVSLTREWTDELCVCGEPTPKKETPRRIQMAPTQSPLKRGMGPSSETVAKDRDRRRKRDEMADPEKREAANARRRKRRQEKKRARAHRPVTGGTKPKRW